MGRRTRLAEVQGERQGKVVILGDGVVGQSSAGRVNLRLEAGNAGDLMLCATHSRLERAGRPGPGREVV